MPDDDPPARKAARAVTSVTHDESSPVGTSTAVSIAQYSAPLAPVMCPVLSGRRRLSLPVSMSLPLPRSTTRDVTPDTAPSLPVEIRPCPSSPGSRSSTPVFDLAEFDSECSRAAMSSCPVSDVVPVAPVDLSSETSWVVPPSPKLVPAFAEVVDRGIVESPELGSDMSTITSRFLPLKPPVSPVSMESVDQVVIESPTSYDAPVAALDMATVAEWLETRNPQESQVSHLSSVQLSPNRVREDFDLGTLDVFPVFAAPLETNGYLPRISPVSSPGSPVAPAVSSLLDEVTGSYHSTIGSPATSLSITDHAANLHLLSEPLIPLPDAVFLHADPTLLLDLTQSYNNCIPTQEPVALVSPPPAFLSRERPFDASTEPAATSNHPLISTGLTGCPYRMTTYRVADLASVDTSFGVQIHHPRFLECVGAPESARLLGHSPTK